MDDLAQTQDAGSALKCRVIIRVSYNPPSAECMEGYSVRVTHEGPLGTRTVRLPPILFTAGRDPTVREADLEHQVSQHIFGSLGGVSAPVSIILGKSVVRYFGEKSTVRALAKRLNVYANYHNGLGGGTRKRRVLPELQNRAPIVTYTSDKLEPGVLAGVNAPVFDLAVLCVEDTSDSRGFRLEARAGRQGTVEFRHGPDCQVLAVYEGLNAGAVKEARRMAALWKGELDDVSKFLGALHGEFGKGELRLGNLSGMNHSAA